MGQAELGHLVVWDARLTSELILLFLYLGYLALVEAIDDPRRADQAGALLALVGAVNVPVIYFGALVEHAHQGATISMSAAPKMASTMLTAMLLMTVACWAYAFAVVSHAGAGDRRRTRAAHRVGVGVGARRQEGLNVQWSSASEFFAGAGTASTSGVWRGAAVLMLVEPWLAPRRARARRRPPPPRPGDRRIMMKPRHKRLVVAGGVLARWS